MIPQLEKKIYESSSRSNHSNTPSCTILVPSGLVVENKREI